MIRSFLVFLGITVISITAVPGSIVASNSTIFTDVPRTADPAKNYLFYLHGAWIEMHGKNRPHPRHGVYEYDKILQTFSHKGFIVISEIRQQKVAVEEYAHTVARQVHRLLDHGVPPENITVIGHSKGGLMALIAASILREENMNFVILAGCGKRGGQFRSKYELFLAKQASQLAGRILSLYDADDRAAGTCQEAFDKSARVQGKEVVLHTGKGHGIFYSPDSVWVKKVVEWAGM